MKISIICDIFELEKYRICIAYIMDIYHANPVASVVKVPLHCNSVGGGVFWNIPPRWQW